jgi:hypothetical protein
MTGGLPGDQVSRLSKPKSDQRAHGSRKQPSKVRSRRQAVKRAQIPQTCRRHGQPATIQPHPQARTDPKRRTAGGVTPASRLPARAEDFTRTRPAPMSTAVKPSADPTLVRTRHLPLLLARGSAAIETTPSAATQRLKALQVLLSRQSFPSRDAWLYPAEGTQHSEARPVLTRPRTEQPVLDVRNQPDSHRPRRTERRLRERRCAHHGFNLATLPRDSLACGNAAGSPRCGNRSHVPQPRTDWVAAMITPTTVAVVLGGALSCLVDGAYRVLLA